MQFSLQLIHFLFISSEAILGFFSLRVLARYQISRFHYKQFESQNKQPDEKDDLDWIYSLEKTAIQNTINLQGLTTFKKE